MTKVRVILELGTEGHIPSEQAHGVGILIGGLLKNLIETKRLHVSLNDPRLQDRPVRFPHSQIRIEVEDGL